MINFLFAIAVTLGGCGYNMMLFMTGEGVNIGSQNSGGGWQVDCRYYTPVRFFVVQVDAGRSCPSRISTP
jgi:hypothetical protein